GATEQSRPNGELPPDIENAWLNHIYDFEKQFKNAKRVKVFERIGKPVVKPLELLNPSEVSVELERIQNIMAEKGIVLDCICDYDDATIYKFIITELFEEETDDIRIEGMFSHFIYEEFHPNHEYDLERHSEDFFTALFTRFFESNFD